ncbi:M1 family aminopeptidase [Candidatus Zixiibacteriota bacterium]
MTNGSRLWRSTFHLGLLVLFLASSAGAQPVLAEMDLAGQQILADSLAPPQKSAALLSLYQAEYQTWLEYIERFHDYQPDNSYDILFYYISVDISVDTEYLQGNVLCRFSASEDNLTSIKLNLHHAYAVDSVTGNAGLYQIGNDTLTVTLDRAYALGETAAITIYYQGVPETVGGLKGLRYETHGVDEPIIATLSTPFVAHYWWPCKDGPGDKPDSVYIDITIPDRVIGENQLIAVSNGVLENVITEAGYNTYQWRHRYPIVTYYVMAAISNYEHFQDHYTGLYGEDFPLDYYCFPEGLSDAQAGVERMPEVIAAFSDLFGPYPFREEKYGMTQLGFYGGIENQTNTIQGEFSPAWFMTSVHEFAHQWFGDMITCADWHHGWLNEGFATYAEALWREHDEGIGGYQSEMAANAYYSSGTLYLSDISDPLNIFISIIYSKGAWAVHMLRGVLGDSLFFECLTQYTSAPEFAYGHATTEDLQQLCQTVSGVDLDYFFDQWIYDEYYPEYHWGFGQDPASNRATLTVFQRQGEQGRRPVFTMPIKLLFWFDGGGDTIITVFNNQIEQTFEFEFDRLVDGLTFDTGNWILKGDIRDYFPILTRGSFAYDDANGNGNGHPEPGETQVQMIFTVTNSGMDAYQVNALAKSLDPELVFEDSVSSFGNVLFGEQSSNIGDPLVFSVAPGIDPTLVHVELTLATGDGQFALVDTLRINIGDPQVLVIDDDQGNPLQYEEYYLEVLDSLHTPFVTWGKDTLASPPVDTLTSYPLAVWFTGNARSEVLSATDVDNLRDFLDGGGRLLLTGQDIAQDLANDADSTFLQDYLYTRFIAGLPMILAEGVDGDPISHGHTVPLGGPGGAANQNSPDILQPLDDMAQPVYTYYGSSDVAGIRVATDDYRVVFLGFGCEAIADGLPGYTKRKVVLTKIFNWLHDISSDYTPGDLNNDLSIDPLDVAYLVNYVYRMSDPPAILNAADVNADCTIDPLDVTFLVYYVYLSLGELQPGCAE